MLETNWKIETLSREIEDVKNNKMESVKQQKKCNNQSEIVSGQAQQQNKGEKERINEIEL